MHAKLETNWGTFQGGIFTRLSVNNPVAILSSLSFQPNDAKPIINYKLRQPRPWHFNLDGCYEGGELGCILAPSSDNWFKKQNLVGKIKINSDFIGNLKVIASADSQRLMEYESNDKQHTLAANRSLNSSESDIIIEAPHRGPIAKIFRWDNSGWREQYKAKFGFANVQRGIFTTDNCPSSDANVSGPTVIMLALYFQIIEHLLNTDFTD